MQATRSRAALGATGKAGQKRSASSASQSCAPWRGSSPGARGHLGQHGPDHHRRHLLRHRVLRRRPGHRPGPRSSFSSMLTGLRRRTRCATPGRAEARRAAGREVCRRIAAAVARKVKTGRPAECQACALADKRKVQARGGRHRKPYGGYNQSWIDTEVHR